MRNYLNQLGKNFNLNAGVFLGQVGLLAIISLYLLFFGFTNLAVWIVVVLILGLRSLILGLMYKSLGQGEFSQRAHFRYKKAWNYLEVFTLIAAMLVLLVVKDHAGQVTFVYPLGVFFVFAYFVLVVIQHFRINQPAFLLEKGLVQQVERRFGRKKLIALTLIKNPVIRFIFEWVDSLVWAIIAIAMVNSFFLQVYEIPSESMVPSFFVGHRPVVFKTANRPQIPFSDIALPIQVPYKRFDVAIMDNPRYPEVLTRTAEQYMRDLGYMLTFSLLRDSRKDRSGVNYPLNQRFDSNMQPLVTPLVKRIIATEGEQLMMLDDIVYIRKANQAQFQPLEADQKYAFNSFTYRPLTKIRQEVMQPAWNEYLHSIDSTKRNLDSSEYAQRIQENGAKLAKQLGLKAQGETKPVQQPTVFAFKSFSLRLPEAMSDKERISTLNAIFDNRETSLHDSLLSMIQARLDTLKKDPAAASELAMYANISLTESEKAGWPTSKTLDANIYDLAAKRLDLYFRDLVLKLMLAMSSEEVAQKAQVNTLGLEVLRFLGFYMGEYYEARNLAAFPEGTGVLAKNEYFAMGDNRYNSFDCRHFNQYLVTKNLVPSDPWSLSYDALNSPFAIKSEYLRGRELATIRL